MIHAASDVATEGPWPDEEWLVYSLVQGVDNILKTYDSETGRFGSKPWVCSDQNVLFPLAAAWAYKHPDNRWHHDQKLLQVICKGGEALVAAQDKNGQWTFRKKDNSTWGQIHMPWTYSRWIRAFSLIREQMPKASRQTWEKGLRLGYSHVVRQTKGRVHNIPAHHAMGLYIAGDVFDNEDWKEAAKGFMAKVVDEQNPNGFWSENYGPVVGYNMVYLDALGIYHAVSGDKTVLPALQRGARFHANFLWPDGTPVSAIDERQVYHAHRSIGNVGFSFTPAGRGYLLYQTAPWREANRAVGADYAAAMLLYGGEGEAKALVSVRDRGQFVLDDKKALMHRVKPWQLCMSAYCCPVPENRWIQDRQNFLDVFHDDLGLVIGGGNTKMQPYWSTFTVGDPELVKHKEGDTNPNFRPLVDLRWVPTRSSLSPDPERPELRLVYHDHVGSVSAEIASDKSLHLTYKAHGDLTDRFEAHIPFMKRHGRMICASGTEYYLMSETYTLTAEDVGDWFDWSGLRVTMPPQATLRWPAHQHNPYKKDGAAPLKNAKLVMSLPFDTKQREHTVVLSRAPERHLDAIVYEARELDVVSPTGTRMKPLDDLGSFFLGATRPGDSMTFTIPVAETGTYELLADFVIFPGYGIVRISIDGTPVGKPFDAYAPELDTSGPVSFGAMTLADGDHDLQVTITGQNPKANRCFVSVRKFYLRPVK